MTGAKWLAVLSLALLLVGAAPTNAPVTPQPIPNALGVSIAWQRGNDWAAQSLALLNPPLWLNWIHDHTDDPRYLPMAFTLRTSYHDRYIGAGKQARHKTWILGNEPDIDSTSTDPVEAATFTQRWRDEVDAPMACCGVIAYHSYTGGLQWLDSYLAAGGAIPDYWHIHIYFVADSTEWQRSLNTFMAWMRANDVVRPVIISETAMTRNGDAEALLRYIAGKINDGTIHAALWYSDVDYWRLWPQSDLRTEGGTLTPLGELYVEVSKATGGTGEEETPTPPTVEPSRRLWLPYLQ